MEVKVLNCSTVFHLSGMDELLQCRAVKLQQELFTQDEDG
jgi:hypothetical protein